MRKSKRMIPKINEESTVRVIILYLLDQLDRPVSYQTLTEIILWDGNVNYFIYVDCFKYLAEKGALKMTRQGGEELYTVSPFGKSVLENTSEMLVENMKKQLMLSATRLLAFKRSGNTVKADIRPDNDGFRLTCTIKDNKFDLLELKLYLDTAEEAKLMKERFDEKAEHIYRGVLALLSGEVDLLN